MFSMEILTIVIMTFTLVAQVITLMAVQDLAPVRKRTKALGRTFKRAVILALSFASFIIIGVPVLNFLTRTIAGYIDVTYQEYISIAFSSALFLILAVVCTFSSIRSFHNRISKRKTSSIVSKHYY